MTVADHGNLPLHFDSALLIWFLNHNLIFISFSRYLILQVEFGMRREYSEHYLCKQVCSNQRSWAALFECLFVIFISLQLMALKGVDAFKDAAIRFGLEITDLSWPCCTQAHKPIYHMFIFYSLIFQNNNTNHNTDNSIIALLKSLTKTGDLRRVEVCAY